MTESKTRTIFPQEVSRVSNRAVTLLERQGFFAYEFDQIEAAKTYFYNRFSQSLLHKFINGDEIDWDQEEYDKVLFHTSVEHAVFELECEGKIHRFEEVVVMAESGF